MRSFFAIFGIPLGWLMNAIYGIVNNYGITLIIFAILFKLLMVPLSIKQQKGMIANARIQPMMADIQKKYANNRQKMAEEMQALYEREHFSPYSSCLPVLVQFPILMGMLDVVYYPIKHMLRLPAEAVSKAVEVATNMLGADFVAKAYSKEICVLQAIKLDAAPFVEALGEETAGVLSNFDFSMFGLFLGNQPTLTPGDKPLGLYLALLIIPVLSGLTSLWMSKLTMDGTNTGDNQAANSMSKSMMFMMPLMSVYISFVVPAGVGIYWLISNLLAVIQTMILNKYMNPKEMAEKAKKEAEERAQKERAERIAARKEARERRAAGLEVEDEMGLSQKELNKRKLAEARKRDALKYGEEYKED